MDNFEDIKQRERDLYLVTIATTAIALVTGFFLGLLAIHLCN